MSIEDGEGLYRSSHTYNKAEEMFAKAWCNVASGVPLKREHALGMYTRMDGTYWWRFFLDFAHERTRTDIELDGESHIGKGQKDHIRDEALRYFEGGWYTLRLPSQEVKLDAERWAYMAFLHIETFRQRGIRLSCQELERLVPPQRLQSPSYSPPISKTPLWICWICAHVLGIIGFIGSLHSGPGSTLFAFLVVVAVFLSILTWILAMWVAYRNRHLGGFQHWWLVLLLSSTFGVALYVAIWIYLCKPERTSRR